MSPTVALLARAGNRAKSHVRCGKLRTPPVHVTGGRHSPPAVYAYDVVAAGQVSGAFAWAYLAGALLHGVA